jgi:hypothetical protein
MEIDEKTLTDRPQQEPAATDRPVPPPLAAEGDHATHGGGMRDTSFIKAPRR